MEATSFERSFVKPMFLESGKLLSLLLEREDGRMWNV